MRGVEAWCEDDRGLRAGPFERRLPGGQVSERSRYSAGVLDGDYEALYASGAAHVRGHYARGSRDGAWRGWHENGKPWFEIHYAAGVLAGSWLEYDDKGEKMFEGTYRNGVLDGDWHTFEHGRVSITGASAAGRIEGDVTGESGGYQIELHYRDNRLHGKASTTKDGKVIYSAQYVDGVEQGSDAH